MQKKGSVADVASHLLMCTRRACSSDRPNTQPPDLCRDAPASVGKELDSRARVRLYTTKSEMSLLGRATRVPSAVRCRQQGWAGTEGRTSRQRVQLDLSLWECATGEIVCCVVVYQTKALTWTFGELAKF